MKQKIPAIAQVWEDYRRSVLLPAGAGRVQLQETRRAFYAASHAVLQIMLQIVAAEPDDEDGVRMLEAMHQECRDFVQSVNRGEA